MSTHRCATGQLEGLSLMLSHKPLSSPAMPCHFPQYPFVTKGGINLNSFYPETVDNMYRGVVIDVRLFCQIKQLIIKRNLFEPDNF